MPFAHFEYPRINQMRENDKWRDIGKIVYQVKNNAGTKRIRDIKDNEKGRIDKWEKPNGPYHVAKPYDEITF